MKSIYLTAFIFLLSALLLLLGLSIFAQPPQAFKYQAVVRGNAGEILQNQDVGIRMSIHDITAAGTIVYQETFSETTNDFGLVNLEIGTGTPIVGTFTGIDWSSDSKFLEFEIDPAGGSSYVSTGTSELLSVPYALYAENAATTDDGDWTTSGYDIYSSNSGKVGVGTSTPEGKLSINSPSGLIGYPSYTKGLVLRDGFFNFGNEFEIQNFSGDTKLAITSTGKIGIGTSTPDAGLHIKGDGWPDSFIHLQGNDTYDAGLRLYEGTSTKWHIFNNATDDKLQIMNSDFSEAIIVADQTNGNVGIGTTGYNSYKLKVEDDFDAFFARNNYYNNYGWVGNQFAGVRGVAYDGAGVQGWGEGNALAGDFHGDVLISGSISKGSGSFLIDHPLDPENKLLRHNFMESPENLVVYRGKAKLNSAGETIVKLPEYFEALTKESEATVMLTSIGKPFLTGYEWENNFKAFKIYGKPDREVSWVVYADRDDPVIHQLARPVEEDKASDNPYCEKGKLIYPEAYGYPESKHKDYEEMIKMKEQINKNK